MRVGDFVLGVKFERLLTVCPSSQSKENKILPLIVVVVVVV